MPNYNAQVPPYSIFPGDVALAFNSEAPAAGQASQQFALPSYAGFPENGRTIRWQTIYGTAPSAVSIVLQTAMSDSDAQYATIDTSAATGGEGGATNRTFCGAPSTVIVTTLAVVSAAAGSPGFEARPRSMMKIRRCPFGFMRLVSPVLPRCYPLLSSNRLVAGIVGAQPGYTSRRTRRREGWSGQARS